MNNNFSWAKYLPLMTKNFVHTYNDMTDTLYLHFDNRNAINQTLSYIDGHVIIQLDNKDNPIDITIYQLHETIKDPQAQAILQKVPSFVIKTAEKMLGIKI